MGKFYAVKVGKTPGIYTDWSTTQAMVSGFPGAIFKGFPTRAEAQAFMGAGSSSSTSGTGSSIITSGTGTSGVKKIKMITIYTDGSNKNNVGGAGVIVLADDAKYTAYARVPETKSTNQIAELYAIYIALSLVPEENVKIYTDSQYVITSLTGYVHDWVKKGWQGVANRTYMENCYDLMQNRHVEFEHVYGHTGNQYNEEADQLAEMGRNNKNDEIMVFQDGVLME